MVMKCVQDIWLNMERSITSNYWTSTGLISDIQECTTNSFSNDITEPELTELRRIFYGLVPIQLHLKIDEYLVLAGEGTLYLLLLNYFTIFQSISSDRKDNCTI